MKGQKIDQLCFELAILHNFCMLFALNGEILSLCGRLSIRVLGNSPGGSIQRVSTDTSRRSVNRDCGELHLGTKYLCTNWKVSSFDLMYYTS